MNDKYSIIRIDNIEIPISFFETNLRVKTKLDELFVNNNDKLNKIIYEMRDTAKRTCNINYGNLTDEYLVSRFRFYFCKSIVYKAVKDAFSIKGSRYSFERNVVKHLTDENLEEAMYGEEMRDTFSKIAFCNWSMYK